MIRFQAIRKKRTIADAPRRHVEESLDPLRKFLDKEIDEDVAPHPGGQGKGKPDDDRPRKTDELIGPDNRPSKDSEDDIRNRQKHDERDADACNDIDDAADLVDSCLRTLP